MTGGPYKGVLHTTEGGTLAGADGAFRKNRSWPHFLIGRLNGRAVVWQYLPINLAARALRNETGGVQTNRDSAVQIEIVAYASKPGEIAPDVMAELRDLMVWIEKQTGIRPVAPTFKAYPSSYGANGVRFSGVVWDGFSGWCGHQHVPENSHGDPGALDMAFLLTRTYPTQPEAKPVITVNRPPVAILTHPTWRGYIQVTDDGGVFTFGPAVPFFGSTGGMKLNAPINGAAVSPSGQGYALMAADGGVFTFGDFVYEGRVSYVG